MSVSPGGVEGRRRVQGLRYDRQGHHLGGEGHSVQGLGCTQHLVDAAVDGRDVWRPGVGQRLLHGDRLLLPVGQRRLPARLKVAGLLFFPLSLLHLLLFLRWIWIGGGPGSHGVGLRHGRAVHGLPQGSAGVEAVREDDDVFIAGGDGGRLAADLRQNKTTQIFGLMLCYV